MTVLGYIVISIVVAILSLFFIKSSCNKNKIETTINEEKKKPKVKEQKVKPKQAPVQPVKAQPMQQTKKQKKKQQSKDELVVPEKKQTFKEQLETLSLNDVDNQSDPDEWLVADNKKAKTKTGKKAETQPTESKPSIGNAKASGKVVEQPVKVAVSNPVKSAPQKPTPVAQVIEATHTRPSESVPKTESGVKDNAINWEKKYNDLLKSKSLPTKTTQDNSKEITELREKTRRLQNMHDALQSKLSARESECHMLKEQLDSSIRSANESKKNNHFDSSSNDPVLIETLQGEIRRLAKELVIVNQRNELLQNNMQKLQSSYTAVQMNGHSNGMNGLGDPASNGKGDLSNKKYMAPQTFSQNETDKLKNILEAKDKELASLRDKIKLLETTKKQNEKVEHKQKPAEPTMQEEELKKLNKTLEKECQNLRSNLKLKEDCLSKLEKKHESEIIKLKTEISSKEPEIKSNIENLSVQHDKQIKEFINRIRKLENDCKTKDAKIAEIQEKLIKNETEIKAVVQPSQASKQDSYVQEMNEKIRILENELNKKVLSITNTAELEEGLKKQLIESEKNREVLNARITELEREIRNKYDNGSINGDVSSICSQAVSEEDFVCLQNQLSEEKNSKRQLLQNLSKLRSLVSIGQDALRDEQAKASKLRNEIIELKRQLTLE